MSEQIWKEPNPPEVPEVQLDEYRNLSIDQFELGNDKKGSYICFKGRADKTLKFCFLFFKMFVAYIKIVYISFHVIRKSWCLRRGPRYNRRSHYLLGQSDSNV